MKKLSQKTEIRRYLEAGGKLTQLAALDFWKCMRLAPRIGEINEDLYNEWLNDNEPGSDLVQVKTEMVKTETGKRIGEYSLDKLD